MWVMIVYQTHVYDSMLNQKHFQAYVSSDILPSDWRLAAVVAAHEKGDRPTPTNHRLIPVT